MQSHLSRTGDFLQFGLAGIDIPDEAAVSFDLLTKLLE